MKFKMAFLVAIFLAGFSLSSSAQMTLKKLGWKLGCQAWSFHSFTFYQAIDSTLACGLHYIEAFPGQPIGGGLSGTMDYHMSARTEAAILAHLRIKGVTLVSYGVVVPATAKDWRILFAFAHSMKLINIVSEPKESDMGLISKLCNRYGINLAIHDHPKPSHYWNPDIVLNAIKGQSSRIGSCADLGHWTRSGLIPLDCVRKLKGHIIELHFKDLNENSPNAHDVPWGTGVGRIADIIRELYHQHFRGVISAEYEYDWGHNVGDIRKGVAFVKRQVAMLPQ